MGAGCLGRIKAGTGAAVGSSSTGLSAASKESKPKPRHFITGGHANHICCNKIGDVMAIGGCEDFYDLEAKKLDGTTVSQSKALLVPKLPIIETSYFLTLHLRHSVGVGSV